MNTRVWFYCFILFAACLSGCRSPNYPARFGYPGTSVLVAGDFGEKNVVITSEVLKNRFRDSFSSVWLHVDSSNGARWDFVRKTEFGDVYLFHIQTGSSPAAIVPVVFSGKPITVVSNSDILVKVFLREESK